MVCEGGDYGGSKASGRRGVEGESAGDCLSEGELASLEGWSCETTDHEAEMVGVSSSCNCAGCNNASNVGNEDGCDFEEACRETEENSDSCGCCRDELWEVAIKMEGNEPQNWSSQS